MQEDRKTLEIKNTPSEHTEWDLKVIASFIISVIFVVMGFYKMFVYSNEEFGDNNINAYVGGDAYNYIINSNYAAAYFLLAIIFTILGCTLLIYNVLQKRGI
ncbi:hypothetical protein [Virgibacillus siamensis]|uniref:hypothetical protein n=1 Tax=Virgibacillus siamensis TaxID=480071 RepID=UPI000985C621|nr:hypothetical protein [Virgibacillus siamensis]